MRRIHLNLDNDEMAAFGKSQFAPVRRVMNAAALGNGCSAAAATSEITIGTAIIGPRP